MKPCIYRFLSKLSVGCCRLIWTGPKEKSVQAIQAALRFTGNAFATLSVERRRSILRQLSQQLAPVAEEDFDNNGKLFGEDFGKRAKERTDATCSLSKSSSVSPPPLPPPHTQRTDTGAKGVVEKAQPIALLLTRKKEKSGARPTLNREGQTRGNREISIQTKAQIKLANCQSPPPLLYVPHSPQPDP